MSLNKNILLISPLPPPYGGIASWTGYVLNYYKNLNGNLNISHYNSAITSQRNTNKSKLWRLQLGIKVFIKHYKGVRKSVQSNNIQVAHITSSASIALFKDYLMIKMLKSKSIKTVLHFRFGRIPQLSESRNWEWKILSRVLKSVDHAIVLDKCSLETLNDAGFNNINLIPNPVAPELLTFFTQTQKVERKLKTLLFVGHVTKQKGIFELIQALKDERDLELRVIGQVENDVKQTLIEQAKNLDLKILGLKSKEEVLKEMMECTCFILPSHTEGFPNVIIEAMMTGTPIIATRVGAIPDMLGNNAGVLIDINDAVAIKNNVLKLLDDTKLMKQLSKNAHKQVIEHYEISRIMKQIEYLWQN